MTSRLILRGEFVDVAERVVESPFPCIERHGDAVLPVTGWLLTPWLNRRGNGDPVCSFKLIAGAGGDAAVIQCVVEGRIAEELAEAGGMREGIRVDVHGDGCIARVELGDLPAAS